MPGLDDDPGTASAARLRVAGGEERSEQALATRLGEGRAAEEHSEPVRGEQDEGARSAEQLISRCFGGYHASAHSAGQRSST